MRTEQEPTIVADTNDRGEIHKHPAYGTITMVNITGGDKTLFGSDLGHNGRVCIRLNTAELRRDLSRDWIHSRGQLLEFEMSHAQFAQFITSGGNGGGTPVTLKWIAGEGDIPGIKKFETAHETFRKEVAAASRERLDALNRHIAKLGDMIESGKMPKAELRVVHSELRRHAHQLPGSMEFVVKSAEEALEKATSDAKIEVEAYISASAKRIGLNHIGELGKIENKGESK